VIVDEIQVLRDVARAQWVESVVVWDTVEDPIRDEGIIAKASGWELRESRQYQAGNHWDWQLKSTLRRRVFGRKTGVNAQTQPTKESRKTEEEELKQRLRELEDLTRQVERARRQQQP
jgi:hypothetical protein